MRRRLINAVDLGHTINPTLTTTNTETFFSLNHPTSSNYTLRNRSSTKTTETYFICEKNRQTMITLFELWPQLRNTHKALNATPLDSNRLIASKRCQIQWKQPFYPSTIKVNTSNLLIFIKYDIVDPKRFKISSFNCLEETFWHRKPTTSHIFWNKNFLKNIWFLKREFIKMVWHKTRNGKIWICKATWLHQISFHPFPTFLRIDWTVW